MVSGSTDAQLSVSADSQTAAQSIANVDINAMAASSGGSSLPVLASSVGVSYFDAAIDSGDESKNKLSIGIIVGVVVGSIVLIAIVGVIVYKRKEHLKIRDGREIKDNDSQ